MFNRLMAANAIGHYASRLIIYHHIPNLSARRDAEVARSGRLESDPSALGTQLPRNGLLVDEGLAYAERFKDAGSGAETA